MLTFNASHVHNEVIDLEGRDLTTSGIKEGYPIGSFYGYVSNGIIRTQDDLNNHPHYAGKQIGDIWFKDINGYDENGNLTGKPDGKVDTADRALFGKVFPRFELWFGRLSQLQKSYASDSASRCSRYSKEYVERWLCNRYVWWRTEYGGKLYS